MAVLKFMDGPLVGEERDWDRKLKGKIPSEFVEKIPVTTECNYRSGASVSVKRNKIVRYARKGRSKKYFLASNLKMSAIYA